MQELCSYGCTAYEYNHNHHTCTRLRLWCDDGITVWNEETMSNERVHIEIFWASMKCWCLTCAVRTLQHILASAAVGSNKLLSIYLCCKMIERKQHLRYVVSFLVYHIFSSNWWLHARVFLPIPLHVWKICEQSTLAANFSANTTEIENTRSQCVKLAIVYVNMHHGKAKNDY